jgi:hypothetical protein
LTPEAMDIETAIPASPMTLRFRRWMAVLVGLAATGAAVFTWLEYNASRQKEQAFTDASRGALEIFVDIAASSVRTQFEANAVRRALITETEGIARAARTPPNATPAGEPFTLARKLARAQTSASKRIADVGTAMAALPEGSELREADLEALHADISDYSAALAEQNEAVDRSERYATQQGRAIFALGLTAIAAALLGLAGLMGAGTAGRIPLVTAGIALAVATLFAASGFLA